ncbi:hypothetical protein GCM10010406_37450 [Streptomyces thermolineatus]|uniref:Trypsin-co-occurring domain-containing protein n=1 Tax=Streptomyces thermolineatus TaxID=44033 RepID=A0ABP5ZM91_9ACTN
MGQLVEFPSADGGTVTVEVADRSGGVVTRGPLHGLAVPERATQSFEDAMGRIQPAVQAVIAQLRSLAQAPDEIHVEFGLGLNAEAGAFVAAAGTSANFSVALTWHRDGSGNAAP